MENTGNTEIKVSTIQTGLNGVTDINGSVNVGFNWNLVTTKSIIVRGVAIHATAVASGNLYMIGDNLAAVVTVNFPNAEAIDGIWNINLPTVVSTSNYVSQSIILRKNTGVTLELMASLRSGLSSGLTTSFIIGISVYYEDLKEL